jgi:putative monooxygenase
VALSVLELDAGAVIPVHVHAKETEVLYLLAGGGTMTIAGVAIAVEPTAVIQIPPGVEHSFTATAATRALQLYSPPGPEQRFKSMK